MNVVINGQPHSLTAGSSLADAVAAVAGGIAAMPATGPGIAPPGAAARAAAAGIAPPGIAPPGIAAPGIAAPGIAAPGIAAAVNGEVVARTSWPSVRLDSGDVIEIVTAVQGG